MPEHFMYANAVENFNDERTEFHLKMRAIFFVSALSEC